MSNTNLAIVKDLRSDLDKYNDDEIKCTDEYNIAIELCVKVTNELFDDESLVCDHHDHDHDHEEHPSLSDLRHHDLRGPYDPEPHFLRGVPQLHRHGSFRYVPW